MTHLITSFTKESVAALPLTKKILVWFNVSEFEHESTRMGSVDLSKVIGMTHPRYSDLSWQDLIPVSDGPNKLKRSKDRLDDLSKTPDYFLSHNKKEPIWSFAEVDGEFFISTGVHRTVIGYAFLLENNLPTIVHGVSILMYKKIHNDMSLIKREIEMKPTLMNKILSKFGF